MTIGEKIRKLRKRAGLTVAEFASRLLVSTSAVQKWEAEKTIPRQEIRKAIAGVLGVDLRFLNSIDAELPEERPLYTPTEIVEKLAGLSVEDIQDHLSTIMRSQKQGFTVDFIESPYVQRKSDEPIPITLQLPARAVTALLNMADTHKLSPSDTVALLLLGDEGNKE